MGGNPSSGCTELVKQRLELGRQRWQEFVSQSPERRELCRGSAPDIWRGLPLEMKLCVRRVDRGGQWGTRRGGTVPEPECGGPD